MKRFFSVLLIIAATGVGYAGGSQEPAMQTDTQPVPERIVSLVPSVTETLFAIGAGGQIAARSDFCTWPEDAAKIPSAGGFDGKTISLERILSFKPDLVCLARGMHDYLVQPLESYGIKTFISSGETVEETCREILQLAELTGHTAGGSACVTLIQEQLSYARSYAVGRQPVTVFWEISAAPYFTCGKDSFITSLLTEIGAVNCFSDLKQSYPQVSEESIIARQPQVIIFPDYTGTEQAAALIAARRGWQLIPAVKNNRIYPVNADLFSRPGPRIGEMALELAALLYPPETGDI